MTKPAVALEEIACTLCGRAESNILPYFHVTAPYQQLQLRQCQHCQLIYQSPRPAQSELEKIYNEQYFEEGHFGGKDKDRSYFNPDEKEDLQHFYFKILDKIRTLKPPPADLIEVGCAGGHFLLTAQEQDYRVTGVEISHYASEQARQRYGLEVYTGMLEQVELETASYDIVYLKDILEHVPDPVSFLQECFRILRPSGLLVILAPNYINTLMMRIYIFLWQHFPYLRKLIWGSRGRYLLDKPFHLFEFTQTTLTKLLHKTNFEVITIDNYTLPPIRIPHRTLSLMTIRNFIRWWYYFMVKLRIFEGDRMDFYCGLRPDV